MQLIIQPDERILLDVPRISRCVVVVPRVCDEHDNQLLSQLKKGSGQCFHSYRRESAGLDRAAFKAW